MKVSKAALQKIIKEEKKDWASQRAKALGVSRKLIIGVIAGA